MAQLEPQMLIADRYRIMRAVGQGGQGTVYEAVDQRLGHRVALKQQLAQGGHEAFRHEAQLLAHVHHPGLPRVTDYFIDPLGHFLVMDFVAGADLGDLMEQRRAMVVEALQWGEQLLAVVAHLHGQPAPILHRDIKPHNLKLADGQIRLLDFGLAKGQAGAWTQPSGNSTPAFTAQYAALEQIQGNTADPRSDLYSVGATLYALLAGAPPVDALTRAAALVQRQPDPLVALHRINPGVPLALSAVLGQALALNPSDRPASAQAFAQQLHRISAGLSRMVTAEAEHSKDPPHAPTVIFERGEHAPRSWRRGWPVTLALVVALGGGAVYAMTRSRPPVPPTPPVIYDPAPPVDGPNIPDVPPHVQMPVGNVDPKIVANTRRLTAGPWSFVWNAGNGARQSINRGTLGGSHVPKGEWVAVTLTVQHSGGAATLPDNFFLIRDQSNTWYPFDRAASLEWLKVGAKSDRRADELFDDSDATVTLLFDVPVNASGLILTAANSPGQGYQLR